jgi:hypothetical protein
VSGTPRNVRTGEFKKLYGLLPKNIQELGEAAFKQFLKDPSHPSLRHHPLDDKKVGSHRPGSWSVSISRRYRVLYVVEGGCNVWYWAGSHAQYDRFTGKKTG